MIGTASGERAIGLLHLGPQVICIVRRDLRGEVEALGPQAASTAMSPMTRPMVVVLRMA